MSMHDEVGGATVNQGGTYPLVGFYPKLEIEALREKISEKHRGHELYIVELLVHESNVQERPPGSRMSVVYNCTKHQSAPGDVKALLAAILHVEPDQIDAATSRASVSSAQPGAGRYVFLEAYEVMIGDNKDVPFTKTRWSPVPEDQQRKKMAAA